MNKTTTTKKWLTVEYRNISKHFNTHLFNALAFRGFRFRDIKLTLSRVKYIRFRYTNDSTALSDKPIQKKSSKKFFFYICF